jgi:hypothetical protein
MGTRCAKVVTAMLRRRVRSVAARALLGSLCAALGGCLSPTLPVPPPDPLALQEPLAKHLDGAMAIQGDGAGAAKSAMVVMGNDELEERAIYQADDSGAYHGLLAVNVSCVRPQNHILLWQTDMDGKSSEVKTYRLPNAFGNVALPPDDTDAGCPDAGTNDAAAAGDAAGNTD